jgi:hypothetical protein
VGFASGIISAEDPIVRKAMRMVARDASDTNAQQHAVGIAHPRSDRFA